jgi:histidine ammonia-lyase
MMESLFAIEADGHSGFTVRSKDGVAIVSGFATRQEAGTFIATWLVAWTQSQQQSIAEALRGLQTKAVQ